MKPFQSASYSVLLAPSAAATAVRTATVDSSGADYATITVNVSAELNTNAVGPTFTVATSDDGTNWTTAATALVDNTAAAVHAFHINRQGKGKTIRLTSTPGTTTNDVVLVSAVAILDSQNQNASSGTVVE